MIISFPSHPEKGGRGKDPVQHSHDFFVISSCKVSAKFKERLDIPTSKGERFLGNSQVLVGVFKLLLR